MTAMLSFWTFRADHNKTLLIFRAYPDNGSVSRKSPHTPTDKTPDKDRLFMQLEQTEAMWLRARPYQVFFEQAHHLEA
jgi:hypothetical protein